MRQRVWHPQFFHHLALGIISFVGLAVLSFAATLLVNGPRESQVARHNPDLGLTLSANTQATADPSASPSPSASATPTTATPPKTAKKTTTSTLAAPAPAGRFGIAAGSSLAGLSTAELGRRLDAMKAVGVSWVRYDIEWSNIEYAGPGKFDWSDYDRVVQAVSSRGLHSLAILDYTPTWARRSSCLDSAMCAPADPAAYTRFAAAAATRYQPYGIRTWEIWNEPNSSIYFKPAADPVAYTALLKGAYTAIKAVDPGATIITGGTSPASDRNGNLSPPSFISGLYAAGARGYFDAIGHHPYTYPFTPANAYPGSAWHQATTLRNIMVAHGDSAKKLWLTEYGAPTGGPDPTADIGQWPLEGGWQVTEALQAKMVTDAIAAYRQLTWAGPFFWYSLHDAGTNPNSAENFFGLLRTNGSAKPAYSVFRQAVTTP